MTDTVQVALILAVSGLTNLYVKHRLDKSDEKQDAIHKEMDGMKDALITSEKIVSKAEGKQEEKDEQAERDKK